MGSDWCKLTLKTTEEEDEEEEEMEEGTELMSSCRRSFNSFSDCFGFIPSPMMCNNFTKNKKEMCSSSNK